MKQLLLIFIFSCLIFQLSAQQLNVEGKIKISEMDTSSTADSLVVWLPDSTLGIRNASQFQILSIKNDTIFLTNGSYVVLPDSDPTNELQIFGKSDTIIALSPGGSTISIADRDNDPENELQIFGKSDTTIALFPGGSTISIADRDNDPENELQIFGKSDTLIALSPGGSTISIADRDNDPTNELQSLSISNDTISISGGNQVVLPEVDNAGWTMDGDTISSDKFIGIGTTNPTEKLTVEGRIAATAYKFRVYTVDTSSTYILSSLNSLTNFPDSIRFTLTDTTVVTCSYAISMPGGSSYIVTQITINDVVKARMVCGNTTYWGISDSYTEQLPPGTYTFKVRYRTPFAATSNPTNDWEERRLQVLVYGRE